MKPAIVNNVRYTTNTLANPITVAPYDMQTNMRKIHTSIVSKYLNSRDNNKIPYCAHYHHPFAALKRISPDTRVAPWPN